MIVMSLHSDWPKLRNSCHFIYKTLVSCVTRITYVIRVDNSNSTIMRVVCSECYINKQVKFGLHVQNIAQSPDTGTHRFWRVTGVSKWHQEIKIHSVVKYTPGLLGFCHHISAWQNTLLCHNCFYTNLW